MYFVPKPKQLRQNVKEMDHSLLTNGVINIKVDFLNRWFARSRGKDQYYDKKEGLFNKFDSTDLTEVNSQAKEHVLLKIPESGLFDTAKSEALEAVLLIQNIVETIGWTLDYEDLLLAKNNKGINLKEKLVKKLEA